MDRLSHRWWQHPDQFDWFTAYINDRGLQTQWRTTTVIFTFALAAVPLALLLSPAGPNSAVTITMSLVASVVGVAGALLWLRRWPTRRQSTAFAGLASASIAASCSAQSDPYTALMGCTTFAVIGGFVAHFHTLALVSFNFVIAMTCATVSAFRLLTDTGDIAMTASAALIVLGLNVGVPFGIHSLTHALRTDLRTSGHDPLTGLLNRRAFGHTAYELLVRDHGDGSACIVVLLVDLDNFKNLNDTRGHAAGDQALAAVGTALREQCPETAVIGRVGGEEFVIVDIGAVGDPAVLAERLRQAIADIPFPITASIGTASAPFNRCAPDTHMATLDALIRAADVAMYIAKHSGGNQVHHHYGQVSGTSATDGSGPIPVR
ncbi:GGDEF domain-containing protein [Mycobacterium sp. MS1601]|uniref:GGDEF domain-containing protein n=1 Tax=Mycobacterium sp. MS1601 TaxID=1936029 RepID=UPI00097914E8|nr:GGDEF domain-containing protein [Mycobacterium sp. MS1601]AQA06447.1 GGDEF domain-containing protein [Mycobacterium sp. MS1601]